MAPTPFLIPPPHVMAERREAQAVARRRRARRLARDRFYAEQFYRQRREMRASA